jgi:hypothetical protein
MAFVEAVVNSVHAVATGAIGAAISWIEKSLANAIPIVIGFLARLIGLGGISQKIRDFIMKVQSKVDQAIDKALKVIVDKIKKLFGKLTGKDKKKPDERTDAEKQRDLTSATNTAHALLSNEDLSPDQVSAKLPDIKAQYKLTDLRIVVDTKGEEGETDHVVGEINPVINKPGVKKKPKTYLGATKKGKNSFAGSFDDSKWNWSGYPSGAVTDHPANTHFSTTPGTKVPKPSGDYTVAGDKTEGNIHTAPWRAIIRDKVDQIKARLKTERPGLTADMYERNAKKEVETLYGGMGYLDLYLDGWDEHHIHPVNWGGTEVPSNLKYLKRGQHSLFTTWFTARKKLILSKL